MIDLETLSVGAIPVITAIGAVKFDPDAETVPQPGLMETTEESSPVFYQRTSIASCLAMGGQFDDRTFNWWMMDEQTEARRYVFSNNPLHISEALVRLANWCVMPSMSISPAVQSEHVGDHIWSHGLLFDGAILQNYFERLGISWPFHYRNARDTRTLFDLCGVKSEGDPAFPEVPVPHHPAWDAWRQARAVQNCTYQLRSSLLGRRSIINAEREACAEAAQGALLPEHYQWGDDAMEQFMTGKQRAAEAIRARGT